MMLEAPAATDRTLVARIRLLGGFTVSFGTRTVTEAGWRLRKARSLVKLLALTAEHRLHREQIMGLLWPGLEPAAAANNLYQALHAARRMLDGEADGDGCLVVSHEIVALCPHRPLWVDVQAFEQAAARARRSRDPAEYRAALDLYAGDLLPDDRYEDWAIQPREDLRQTHLGLIVELAGLLETRGEPASAIELLERAVRQEPTQEEAHRRLMVLYALTGNHYRARRQYQILKDALRRDLDTEPDPQTQRLYRDILDGRIVGMQEMQQAGATPAVLQTALDDAYAGLADPEQAIFRRLATFAGGSAQEAISAVCGEGIERHRLQTMLSKLAEGSLVIADPHGQEIRYRMLETVRRFAHRRLDDAGETHLLRRRHCNWFVSFAERAEPELSGPDAPLWLHQLDVEHENLRAALAFCREDDPTTGARLAAALWQFWEIRGHLAEGRQWLDEMLARGGPDLAPAPRARVLLGAGTLASRQGDHRGAQPMLQTSLRLFEEIGDQWGIAWALDNLGMLVLADGELRQARTMFERSRALFERVGDRRGTACVRDNLGWTAMTEGRHDEAKEHFQQALATFRDCGDRRGTGRALANLANVFRIQGDRAAARTLLSESLQFCQVDTGKRRSWLGSLRHSLRRSLLFRLQFISWSGALGPVTLPCAGVCAGYPLIASLSTPGVIPLWAVVAHLFVLPVVVPLNVLMLVVSFRRHHQPWALIAGVLGGALTFAALAVHVVPGLHRALVPGLHRGLHDVIWPAMGLLLTAVVLDWRARRRLHFP